MSKKPASPHPAIEAKRIIQAVAPALRRNMLDATIDPPSIRIDALALAEAALALVDGERGGWCPECEKEGKDPRHSRTSILCGRHWRLAYAQTESGQQAAERYKSRQYERRSPFRRAMKEGEEQSNGEEEPTGS